MSDVSYHSLEEAVAVCFGEGVSIREVSFVGGGDINEARCLKLSSGEEVFVKSNTAANHRFFEAEEQGLRAIAATCTIPTPHLLCRGVDAEKNSSFLMLEMIRSGRMAADFWEHFARSLAAMHRADTQGFVEGGRFGFAGDNYIGASVQHNTPRDSWIDFFRQCRLEPQVKIAQGYFDAALLRGILRLLDRLDELLIEPEHPSLIHGDLWSGNFMVGADGQALLIDPAAYVGHAEADLAMTQLFGGFDAAFYVAYREAAPLEPGYEDRRDLYNLYHLLNHLNLFGGGYLGAVAEIVRRYS